VPVSVTYRLLADGLVLVHFGFVLFVVLGGLLLLRWPPLGWVHLPAAAWGVWIELSGGICPLTPLEQALRRRAGGPVYTGDFVGQYILPVLYPHGLTREIQLVLGAVVVGVNVIVYWWVWRRQPSSSHSRSKRTMSGSAPSDR
jgi:hypothetical protein